MENEQAFVQEFKPTIWYRLGFGHAYVAPFSDKNDDDAHYLCTDVTIVMDWKDRLRTFLTGRVHIATRTRTDVLVKTAESRSAVKVMGWGWP